MKKRILSLVLTLGLVLTLCPAALAAGTGLSNFKSVNTYGSGTFKDVPANTWYTENVKSAYELDLMKGTSSVAFSPDGNITIGSTIALACRLHSIYNTGKADFVQGNPWYQVYVDYAVKNGIITQGQYTNYDAAATRRQFAAILAKYRVVNYQPLVELDKSHNCVKAFASSLSADIPTDHNPAKQLALATAGKTVLVYSSSLFYPLAYKWKTSYNENAKNTIWCNEFPEFNHNEFIGWTSHPIDKPFAVINLRSNLDNARINQRLELTEKLLSGHRPSAHNIVLTGDSYIQQVLCGAILGDISSIYLGLLNGVDPTPVELVERFKKELG